MLPKNPAEKLPKVSVVIPAYNEEKTIAQCLQSIANQSYPAELIEIILVDNNCTDQTVAIAQTFAQVIVIKEFTAGVGAARATGWARATGDLIASTDSDCEVPTNWIERMVHIFMTEPDTVAMGGGYDFYNRGRLFNWFSYSVEIALVNISYFLSGGVIPLTGNNLAVRRASYLAVGGFNPKLHFGEDMDLGRRLHFVGQVRWLNHSRIRTSPRRYAAWNWLIDIIPYLWNFLTMSATNQAWRNHLQNHRD